MMVSVATCLRKVALKVGYRNSMVTRSLCVASSEVKVVELEKQVILTTPSNLIDEQRRSRPIVIIYKWLGARPRDVWKYEKIYLDRGFDVVTAGTSVLSCFGTLVFVKLNDRLYKAMTSPQMAHRPFILHSFSVGTFISCELRKRSLVDSDFDEKFASRLIAQIYDSFIDDTGAYHGYARTLAGESKAAVFVEWLIKYFEKFSLSNPVSLYSHTVNAKLATTRPFLVPTMFYYSHADPVGYPEMSETAAKKLKQLGLLVHTKCWDDSLHCGHLRYHRDEYIRSLDTFLSLLPSKANSKEILRS